MCGRLFAGQSEAAIRDQVVPEEFFSATNRGCIAVIVALKFARFWSQGPESW